MKLYSKCGTCEAVWIGDKPHVCKEDELETTVVFRMWKKEGGVIALFPYEPHDVHGYLCTSFMHIGQHAGADYTGVVMATRPATPEEYAPLAKELTGRGYKLRIRTRRDGRRRP